MAQRQHENAIAQELNAFIDRRVALRLGASAILGAVALSCGAMAVRAGPDKKSAVFTEFRSGLALDGYDAVAYHEAGAPTKGSSEFTAEYNGAKWRFASAETRDRFIADPARYAPQYGGYCAWAAAEGYTAKGDPRHWKVVDGKLYLNFNGRIQRRWEQDIPGHIAKADANWPGILG